MFTFLSSPIVECSFPWRSASLVMSAAGSFLWVFRNLSFLVITAGKVVFVICCYSDLSTYLSTHIPAFSVTVSYV